EFIPGDKMNAHMQATIGVPLANIPQLYEAMGEDSTLGPQTGYANTTRKRAAAAGLINLEGTKVTVSEPPIPVKDMSDSLKGFLMLVIDYLRSGYTAQYTPHQEFPKAVLSLMAKTSFTRMLELVQNEADLTEQDTKKLGLVLKDEWVNWLIQAAIPEANSENVDEQRQKRLLNHKFGITAGFYGDDVDKNETPYQVEVTRGDWLRNLPREDMMRLDNDTPLIKEQGNNQMLPLSDKLEGFAALKNKTDKLVQDVSNQMAQNIIQNSEKEDDSNGDSGENPTPLLESIQPTQDNGKGDKGKEPMPTQPTNSDDKNNPLTNAPVFEMRQLEVTGGTPDTWADNAMKAWGVYEKAIGDQVYRAGNRENLEGDTKGYKAKVRQPPQQVQNNVQQLPPQPIPLMPIGGNNPPQRGFKAKMKRLWKSIKSRFKG
ncbi:MAG TPA: hypothetical protein VHD90_03835, partial [Phototrophicaceae bacterium]|nr:hypothetical protein [Phototrophicaceae bacterium]